MATTIDDNFIWRSYLDKMSGTLETIRDTRYIQKAQQYASLISEIEPDKFEEQSHQKKVREVVLFIKDAMKSDMTRSNLKPIVLSPRVLDKIENAKDPEPIVVRQILPSTEPVVSQLVRTRKHKKKKRNRNRHRK